MKKILAYIFLLLSADVLFSQHRNKNLFSESFEGTFPPSGWSRYMPDGGSGWRADTAGTSLNGWTGAVMVSTPTGGGSRIACFTYIDGGSASNDSWLITPQLTVSSGEYLMFRATNFTPYEDTIDILISTTSNAHTSFTHTLLAFSPSMNGIWTKYLINLAAYSGQQVYIAFRAHVNDNYNYGGYLGLDKVEIAPPPSTDAGILRILAPNTGCSMGSEHVTVTIKNFGTYSISDIPIHYRFNNGPGVNDVYMGDIPAGGTYDFTFSSPVDASSPGIDSIYAWTSLAGDQDTTDDRSPLHFFGNTLPSAVPYSFHAEWGTADWNEAYYWAFADLEGNGYWDYGEGAHAHAGTGYWVYYGSPSSAANDWLMTKCINMTGGVNYEISFWYKNSTLGGKVNKMKLMAGISQNTADFSVILDLNDINDGNASSYTRAFAYYSPSITGEYYLGWQVYSNANNGNLYLDDILIDHAENINDLKSKEIRVFPVPASDVVYILAEKPISGLILYDIHGSMILTSAPGSCSFSMNIDCLNAGVYFIDVITGEKHSFQKVIVK